MLGLDPGFPWTQIDRILPLSQDSFLLNWLGLGEQKDQGAMTKVQSQRKAMRVEGLVWLKDAGDQEKEEQRYTILWKRGGGSYPGHFQASTPVDNSVVSSYFFQQM